MRNNYCLAQACLLILICVSGSAENPVLTLFRTEIHLSDVSKGESRTLTIEFKNTGEDILKIAKIVTDCGCLASKLKKTEFLPGESGTIVIDYEHKGGPGQEVKRQLTVISNDPVNPMRKVLIVARAPESLTVFPQRNRPHEIHVGNAYHCSYFIAGTVGDEPLEVETVSIDGKHSESVQVSCRLLRPDEEADEGVNSLLRESAHSVVQLDLQVGFRMVGRYQYELVALTNSEISPRVKIPIAFNVIPPMVARPGRILFRSECDSVQTRQVRLFGDSTYSLVSWDTNGLPIQVELKSDFEKDVGISLALVSDGSKGVAQTAEPIVFRLSNGQDTHELLLPVYFINY